MYVSAFNVEPSFAEAFILPKKKGGGNFDIVTLMAAFDKTACFGEFFMEFETHVWDNHVIEQFEAMGAGSVSTLTFPRFDNDAAAVNALYRIHTTGEKFGSLHTKGRLSETLASKLTAKIADEKHKESIFDAKTVEALKASMDDIGTKLASHDQVLNSASVTIDVIKDAVDSVQYGVCEVIMQQEIGGLKDEVAKRIFSCKQQEGKTSKQTREVNLLKAKLEERDAEVRECKRKCNEEIHEYKHLFEVNEYRSALELSECKRGYELKIAELRNTAAENQRIKDENQRIKNEIYRLTESMNQRKLVTNSTATFIPIYDPRKLFPK